MDGNEDNSRLKRFFIVTQVKSNRIIYYTDDQGYVPAIEDDWFYVSTYLGELPRGMSLKNCWNWRFNGGVFVDAAPKVRVSSSERLLENNRNSINVLLLDKLNSIRAELKSEFIGSEYARRMKYLAACEYLGLDGGESPKDLCRQGRAEVLYAVAASREISLNSAAELIVEKFHQDQQIIISTEIIKEEIIQRVKRASTDKQLFELRDEIMRMSADISSVKKFKADNTTPLDRQAPLSPDHLFHEKGRLKFQLKQIINRLRNPLKSDYLAQDDIWKHKLRLAQLVVSAAAIEPAFDVWVEQRNVALELLLNIARARKMDILAVSRELVGALEAAEKLVTRTEIIKDTIIAKIDAINNIDDIADVEADLRSAVL